MPAVTALSPPSDSRMIRGKPAGHFTWLAQFPALDIPASSTLTRELTGWQPTQPGLIEDLEKGHYFNTRNEVA